MFPQGILINLEKDNLVTFEADFNNPENEGFICYWAVNDLNNRQLIFKQRLTKEKAKIKFKLLIQKGWKNIEYKNIAA